jgi:hypothetical protein
MSGVSALACSSSPSAEPARSRGCFWDFITAVVVDAAPSVGSWDSVGGGTWWSRWGCEWWWRDATGYDVEHMGPPGTCWWCRTPAVYEGQCCRGRVHPEDWNDEPSPPGFCEHINISTTLETEDFASLHASLASCSFGATLREPSASCVEPQTTWRDDVSGSQTD